MNYYKKSVSTIIAAIVVILIAVGLSLVILNWGKTFSSKQTQKVNEFYKEDLTLLGNMYASDKHSSWFKLQNNSSKPITFNKYKIVSNNGLDFLKDIYIDYDIPITLIPGQSTIIPLICSPERSFKLNLVTSEDKYISISMNNIIDYKENFCNDLPNPVCLGLKENGIGDSVDNPSIVCDANDLDNIRNGLDKYYLQGNNIDLNVEPYNEETDYDFNIINKYTSSSSYNTNYTSVTQILETKADLLLKEVYYLPYTTGDYKLEIGSTNGAKDIYEGDIVSVTSTSSDYTWDLSSENVNLAKNIIYYFKITTPSTYPKAGYSLYDGDLWKSNGNYFEDTFNPTCTLRLGIKADYTNGPIFGWSSIGDYSDRFNGYFNGNGYTIDNLYINRPSTNYTGLFGYTDSSSNINNMTLIDTNIFGDEYSGSLVGYNNNGIIFNSSSNGNVSSYRYVGGLIGYNSEGTISNSSFNGNVSPQSSYSYYMGGLVGSNYYGTILLSSSYGTVSGGSQSTGGLVGYNSGEISQSYSVSSVSGSSATGGLVGTLANTISAIVENSYSHGDVYRLSGSTDTIAGLIGDNDGGIVINSYSLGKIYGNDLWLPTNKGFSGNNLGSTSTNNFWDIETSLQTTSSSGAIGKTTTEMKTQNTFTDWDFDDIWKIENNNYPYLQNNLPQDSNTINFISTSVSPGNYELLSTTVDLFSYADNIYYTLDGNSPSCSGDGVLYDGPLTINSGFTSIKAIACSGYMSSNIFTFDYNLLDPDYVILTADDLYNVRNDLDAFYVLGADIDLNVAPYNETIDYGFDFIDKHYTTDYYCNYYTSLIQLLETKADLLLKEVYYRPYTTGSYKLEIGTTIGANDIYEGNTVTVSSTYVDYVWDISSENISLNNNTVYYFKITTPSTRPRESSVLYDGYLWKSNGYQRGTWLYDTKTLAFGIKADYTNGPAVGWDSIGNYTNKFTGAFDGAGYTISNLYINRPVTDYQGLFGYTNTSKLNNINLEDVNIFGKDYVGSLIGYNYGNHYISNNSSTGNISGNEDVGGLIGYSWSSPITSCSFIGSIIGEDNIGGLVGYSKSNTLYTSYTNSTVSGTDYLGGLVGNLNESVNIENCYALGEVNRLSGTEENIGGLIGHIYSSSNEISNSYSTVLVHGNNYWFPTDKGFSGNNSGSLENNFLDLNTSLQNTILTGVTAKTTIELKKENTFTNWDFTDIWSIDEDSSYPYLIDNEQTPHVQSDYKIVTDVSPDYYQSAFKNISLSSDAEKIYYSIDETIPDCVNSGIEYTSSIKVIAGTTTIKAIACENNLSSNIFSFTYELAEPDHIVLTVDDLYNVRDDLNAFYVLGSDLDLDVAPYNKTSNYGFNVVAKSIGTSNYYSNYTSIVQILETKANLLLKEVYYYPLTTGNYKLEIGTTNGASDVYSGEEVTVSQSYIDYVWDVSSQNISLNKNTVYYFKITTPSGYIKRNYSLYDGSIWKSNGYYYDTTLNSSATLPLGIKVDYTNGPSLGWNSIGDSVDKFTGVFDGNNYTINNLYINKSATEYQGLFGYIGRDSKISNLNLEDVNILGYKYVGGLVGYNYYGTISNSSSSGNVSGNYNTGGLIGYNSGGSVFNNFSNGIISSTNNATGGLIGYNTGGQIYFNYSSANVYSSGYYAGGLIGQNYANCKILNNYSLGNVIRTSGTSTLNGGFLGYYDSDSGNIINNCYSRGRVIYENDNNPTNKGFSGNDLGTVGSNNFWDTNTSLQSTSGLGSTGKTLTEMKTQNTFSDWDFTNIWAIDEGSSYPYLINNEQISHPTHVINVTSNYISGTYKLLSLDISLLSNFNIMYTTNGTDPSCSGSGTLYTGPITITTGTTNLKVIGCDGDLGSDIVNYTYELQEPDSTILTVEDLYNVRNDLDGFYVLGADIDLNVDPYKEIITSGSDYVDKYSTSSYYSSYYSYVTQILQTNAEITHLKEVYYRPYATGSYKLEIGTTNGANDIYEGNTVTVSSTYVDYVWDISSENISLNNNTVYYFKITTPSTKPRRGYSLHNGYLWKSNGCYFSSTLKSTYTLSFGIKGDYIKSTGSGWNPIGNSSAKFTGALEGNDYTISNLYINRSSTDYIGLFGYIDTNGQINNLNLENVNISGHNYISGLVGCNKGKISNTIAHGLVYGYQNTGGVIGYNYGGNISNSIFDGNVSGSYNYTGGLVGYNYYGTISNSSSSGNISGNNSVGGLVGYICYSNISNNSSNGDVSGTSNVGGLVGYITHDGSISTSFSTSDVSGTSNVGGFVGNMYNGDFDIINSYSLGNVIKTEYNTTNYDYISGFLGGPGSVDTIKNCYSTGRVIYEDSTNPINRGFVDRGNFGPTGTYISDFWDKETSLQTSSSYGAGKTTAEMKTQNTFTDWDFDTIWTINEGSSYPYLQENEQSSPPIPKTYVIADYDLGTYKLLDLDISLESSGDLIYYTTNGTNPSCSGSGTLYTGPITITTGTTTIKAIGCKDGYNNSVNILTYILPEPDYIISNADDLYNIRNDLDAFYVLGSNINLDTNPYNEGEGWNPIGNSSTKFTGTIDGSGYTINNLYINRPSTDYLGLFGYIDSSSIIKNIILNNIDISGDDYIGGISGYNKGTIINGTIDGSVSADQYVGGLVGYNYSGSISNSSSDGNISASNTYVGGLVGFNYSSGNISKCFSTSDVSSSSSYVGGLVGYNYGTIENSYSLGNIIRISGGTSTSLAGFLGYRNSNGTITNCYSTGRVIYDDDTNPINMGFSASNLETYGVNNFWDTETSLQSRSGNGATGKTTTEMKTQSTFTDWDFYRIWNITEGATYPYLRDNTPGTLPQ